jgi:hypothetical protein
MTDNTGIGEILNTRVADAFSQRYHSYALSTITSCFNI